MLPLPLLWLQSLGSHPSSCHDYHDGGGVLHRYYYPRQMIAGNEVVVALVDVEMEAEMKGSLVE